MSIMWRNLRRKVREREHITIAFWLLFPVRKLQRVQMFQDDDEHLSFLSYLFFFSLIIVVLWRGFRPWCGCDVHSTSSTCKIVASFDRSDAVINRNFMPQRFAASRFLTLTLTIDHDIWKNMNRMMQWSDTYECTHDKLWSDPCCILFVG